MRLIECKNQEQIINALLIKKNNNCIIIDESDINSLLFIIEKDEKYVGVITLSCIENSVEIKSVILNKGVADETKFEALDEIEKFSKDMNFDNIICRCIVEESYTYKQLDYQTFGDIFIEDEILYIKMAKKIA